MEVDIDGKIALIEDLIKKVDEFKHTNTFVDIIILEKQSTIIIKEVFGYDSDYLRDLKELINELGSTINIEDHKAFDSEKEYLLGLLKVMVVDLSTKKEILELISKSKNKKPIHQKEENKARSNRVFIVHGHNNEMKLAVRETLKTIGLEPIVLHEQANEGKTIIEKFEKHSNVGFAVVLLSADDLAYPQGTDPKKAKHRARQNVIFELGFFLGKLGRKNVVSLYEDGKNIEIPSDYGSVLYVPFDKQDGWKHRLCKELKNSGFKVDANSLI